MKRLGLLSLFLLAGCQEAPRYQLLERHSDAPGGNQVLRMDTKTGQVEMYTREGWKVLDRKAP